MLRLKLQPSETEFEESRRDIRQERNKERYKDEQREGGDGENA